MQELLQEGSISPHMTRKVSPALAPEAQAQGSERVEEASFQERVQEAQAQGRGQGRRLAMSTARGACTTGDTCPTGRLVFSTGDSAPSRGEPFLATFGRR